MSESDHDGNQKRREFDEKWHIHYKNLYPYVLNLTRNKADAEDITQETLMRYRQHMEKKQWETKIEDADAYRRGIAYNLYMDLCKRRKREGQVSTDNEDDERTSKEAERKSGACDSTIAKIEADMHYKKLFRTLPLKVILSGLSEYELKLLRLKKVEGKSNEEVAETLNEDVFRVRYDSNKLDAKLRYRVKKLQQPENGRFL